jgi:hypothetical protein
MIQVLTCIVAIAGVAIIVARLAFTLPAPDRHGLSHAIPACVDTPMGRIA